MKYIKLNLEDNTPVKFKFTIRYCSGGCIKLYMKWKYDKFFKSSNYIFLTDVFVDSEVEYLEQLTDEELIIEYSHLIEKEHSKIKNTKRKIV